MKRFIFLPSILFLSIAAQAQPTPLGEIKDGLNLLVYGAPHSTYMPVVGFMIRSRSMGLNHISLLSTIRAHYSGKRKFIDLSTYKTMSDVDRFFSFDLPGFIATNVGREVLIMTGQMSPSIEQELVKRLARIIADEGYTSNGLKFTTANHAFFIEVSPRANLADQVPLLANYNKASYELSWGNHDLLFFRLDQFQSILNGCQRDLFSMPSLSGDELWKSIVDASRN